MSNKMFLMCTITVGCLLAGAIVYSQLNPAPVTPQVEIEARFASADLDKNGTLSKDEFGKYLNVLQRTTGGVKICAKTGQPCTHTSAGASGEGGCCGGKGHSDDKSGGTAAGKEGGCCGGKDKPSAAGHTDHAAEEPAGEPVLTTAP